MAQCNHDCFNCAFEDCISDDGLTGSEWKTSTEIDKAAKSTALSEQEKAYHRKYNKAYRLKNLEKLKEYDRIRYMQNKEKISERKKAWYQANREKCLARDHRNYMLRKKADVGDGIVLIEI